MTPNLQAFLDTIAYSEIGPTLLPQKVIAMPKPQARLPSKLPNTPFGLESA